VRATVNALQDPPALHIACTRLTVPAVDDFLRDLRLAVDEVKALEEPGKGSMVMLCASLAPSSSTRSVQRTGADEPCARAQTDSGRAARSAGSSSARWPLAVRPLFLSLSSHVL